MEIVPRGGGSGAQAPNHEGRLEDMVRRKVFTSKEELEQLYIEQEKSTHEIGAILKADSKTIWYWLKKHGIQIRSRSESLKGDKSYMYGKHHTKEHKKRVSEKLKGRTHPREIRQKLSRMAKQQWKNPTTRKRILNVLRSKAYRDKMSKIIKKRAENPDWIEKLSKAQKRLWKDPEERSKRIKATRKALFTRPTLPEQRVISVIQEYDLPFRYVGDGEAIVAGLNPDFISFDNQKIIEVFGRVFHDPEQSFFEVPWNKQYWGRLARYSQSGYDCLILWDDELDDEIEVVEKIRRLNNV